MLNKLHKLREERAQGDKGFTLIELLVVVVIIGILIAIAIPLYLNYQKGAKNKATQSDVRAAVATIEQCYTDNSNSYPVGPLVINAAKTAYTFTAGCASTINVSSGTTLTYAPLNAAVACTANPCANYTISGTGPGGNTYSYDSLKGGQIQ
ncbi:MAG: prepilin-type N-terminal cleavage/methylation domain-containing protein [Jatrophihabitantaceae bacterium]